MTASGDDSIARRRILDELGFLRIVILVFYAVILLRTAWLSDDGFITFRTIDNFLHGYGLRWNVAERVQTYTHPLWMLLLIIPHALSGEAFWSTHLVSIAVSLTSMGLLLWKVAERPGQVLIAGTTVLFCNSYIDFSTSGLENPLTHLLIVLYVLYLRKREPGGGLRIPTLFLSLFILTRHDLLLIALPPFLWCVDWKRINRRLVIDVAIGLSPLILWEVFSVVYYGFPVPNTAYAKLGGGIPKTTVLTMGINYIGASFLYDPLPLITIAVGVLSALFGGTTRTRLLALGAALYTVYIVWVGGDFMAGRFLTAPFLVSLVLIVERVTTMRNRAGVYPWAAVTAAAGLVMTPTPAIFTSTDYSMKTEAFPWTNGVCSERAYYYPYTSLLRNMSADVLGRQAWVRYGKGVRSKDVPTVHIYGAIGFRGYFGGPELHLIDYHALCDPLLARVPTVYPAERPGHLKRSIPAGYVLTQQTGKNRLKDKNLAEFYDAMAQIVRGPLFSWERIKAIVGMNLRQYDSLIDREFFTYPKAVHVALSDLAVPRNRGARWDGPGMTTMEFSGVRVALEDTDSRGSTMEVSLDLNDVYRFRFLSDGALLDTLEVGPSFAISRGMEIYTVAVPEAVLTHGFDEVHVVPVSGDEKFSLGHLILK